MTDLVTSSRQLQDALQSYADEKRVGVLDGKSKVDLDHTITIEQNNNDGTPWGVRGGYAKIDWKGPGGDDMIVFKGVKGVSNRNLVVEDLSFYGGGYDRAPAGTCLKLYAPQGDPGCLYKWTVKNIYTSYGTVGIGLIGAVFEGLLDNVHAENHRSHGIEMEHTHTPGEHQGIVSNVMIMHPNSSRNFGAGIKSVYSCNIIFGSFVLNALGGVLAPEGLRNIAFSNGENTGECLFDIGSNGYGTVVFACEASSDGATVCRAYENGGWVDKGKPMLYGMTKPNGVDEQFNHCSYYGAGPGNPMRWIK